MTSERAQAIILRRTNYGEADRILSLLTDKGRRSVIAKSVRRQKSKLAGGIELFAISDVVITTSKGKLDILTSARLVHFYGRILEDYDRLQFGYEATNAVTKASEQVDGEDWFDVLSQVYAGLDNFAVPLQLVQTWFYLHHADLSGYGFNLAYDVAGKPLDAASSYMYDVSERGLRRAEQGDVTADHIKLMRLLANKPLSAIVQIGGIDDVLPECWMVAREHASI